MNAVYTVLKKIGNSDAPIVYIDLKISSLSHIITGQAAPENCSAITEAVLHEVIVCWNGTITLLTESLRE